MNSEMQQEQIVQIIKLGPSFFNQENFTYQLVKDYINSLLTKDTKTYNVIANIDELNKIYLEHKEKIDAIWEKNKENVENSCNKIYVEFITNCDKDTGKKLIYSINRNYSSGKFYEDNNWILETITKPEYQFIKSNKLYNRLEFQDDKLENIIANGYDRFWDCGTKVYSYNNI